MTDSYIRDQYDRPMKSLRLSVTDRCNFACTYCMPENGPEHLSPKEEILSFEEMTRLTEIFVDMGVDNVRITGGEPLLRRDLHKLVAMISNINGVDEVAMTTNGYLLADRIESFTGTGLDRMNISLDSLREERFAEITQRPEVFEQVMEGLDRLLHTPDFHPIKLNVVAIRGFNDDEFVDFARWAVKHEQTVRFIEFMPLEGGGRWSEEQVILMPEIRERIEEEFCLEPVNKDPHATSTRFRISGTGGRVGFIPSVSNPFCDTCDRVRLTAEGSIKNCLFAYEEDDLRKALRRGAGPERLKELIRENYQKKWVGGCVKLKEGEYEPGKISRTMSRIGG